MSKHNAARLAACCRDEQMAHHWIMVFQIRSPIRRHWSQRATLAGLGLKGIRSGVVVRDTPETQGMIRKVRHLVHVVSKPLGRPTEAVRKDFDVLRRFNRRVDRTKKSAFWTKYADEIPNVMMRMDNIKLRSLGDGRFEIFGKVFAVLQDFDQDEINAFVLDYRQYTQNNDPISIGSLSAIYQHAWVHRGARQRFEEARSLLNKQLDAPSSLIFGDYRMPVRELVDIVVYGGLAHANADKAAIFEQWEASGIMGLVWAEFFAAMRGLMTTLKHLRTLNQQVLDVVDPLDAPEPLARTAP